MVKKNLKSEIAKKAYLDPKSPTFLNKTQSMIAAGYSETYARAKGMKMYDDIKFTDADYANFKTFMADIPQISLLIKKKLQELATIDKISAKDYANLLRHIEILAKALGVLKQIIEKKEVKISIAVPVDKCPKCGYEYDVIAYEKEKIEERIKQKDRKNRADC